MLCFTFSGSSHSQSKTLWVW